MAHASLASLSSVARLGATLSTTSLSANLCIDDDVATACASMSDSVWPFLSVAIPKGSPAYCGVTAGCVSFSHRGSFNGDGGWCQPCTLTDASNLASSTQGAAQYLFNAPNAGSG